ncbi:MAG: hypothetical protein PF542_03335 [Nanoarchaeota archaeon]|jgi:lipopolysaccharide/colanic/teichoic acid biosynthesis glycosyltransferase|nr:hypothetical protein [Nanoarchaeota archaeon]
MFLNETNLEYNGIVEAIDISSDSSSRRLIISLSLFGLVIGFVIGVLFWLFIVSKREAVVFFGKKRVGEGSINS